MRRNKILQHIANPYRYPQAAPYNAPQFSLTPTPDYTGSAVHPSVVDFGEAGWNGWRYWMGMTPYWGSQNHLENPCVLVSSDGDRWMVPVGLTNPIAPKPVAENAYNSDTHLVYDADNDYLVLFWRETESRVAAGSMYEYIRAATSTDGVTWTDQPNVVEVTGADRVTHTLSPAVLKVGATWHMFTVDDGAVDHRTAPSPLGPWSEPVRATWTRPLPGDLWHLDVIYHDGAYRMLANCVETDTRNLSVASSSDGDTWRAGGAVMRQRPDRWDRFMYRACFLPHPELDTYRVWYSASGASSWRIGLTEMPQALWPAP